MLVTAADKVFFNRSYFNNVIQCLLCSVECFTIQVKIGMSTPFLVTSLYAPHNTTDYLNKIDSLIACIDTRNKQSIIIGDTNCDFIKPTNYTTH